MSVALCQTGDILQETPHHVVLSNIVGIMANINVIAFKAMLVIPNDYHPYTHASVPSKHPSNDSEVRRTLGDLSRSVGGVQSRRRGRGPASEDPRECRDGSCKILPSE